MIWIDFTIWACVLALSFIVLGGLLLLVFRVAKPVERQKKNKTGVKACPSSWRIPAFPSLSTDLI